MPRSQQPKEEQAATQEPEQWVTVEHDEGAYRVVLHAAHPYGARSAAVHRVVEMTDALDSALADILDANRQDVADEAEEAALTHRTRARQLGEDYRLPLEYVDAPTITGEVEAEAQS
jgi:hypothetical protein